MEQQSRGTRISSWKTWKVGDVANYNIIVPDQQDDMHNIGTQPRADAWANNVIAKIQSSAIWKDPNKRVAIVVTFDEGESASTACCGWNTKRTWRRRSAAAGGRCEWYGVGDVGRFRYRCLTTARPTACRTTVATTATA